MKSPREDFDSVAIQHAAPEANIASVSRRDTLRFLLGSAGSAALGACSARQAVQPVPNTVAIPSPIEAVDRKTPFLRQWNEAIYKGMKEFEASDTILGPEGNRELVGIVRDFDLGGYIDDLARLAGIPPETVGGQIESFSLQNPRHPHDVTMAEVEELRHMKLHINEWMRYRGQVHAPTIRATLRHELAHMFSTDYSKESRVEGSIPLAYEPQTPGWIERGQLGLSLYEGTTEVVARLGSKAFGERNLEQGYRGGSTLSAYTLSKLLGEKDLLRAYLTGDTKFLKELFETKFGTGSHQNLTRPVIIGSNLYGTDSLDFLHQAYKHPQIGRLKVESLLAMARQEGISERAMHVPNDGCRMTTHLYQLNDADEPPHYSFNAVLEAPDVYRYGKVAYEDGSLVRERFGITVVNQAVTPEEMEKDINVGVKSLKTHCAISDPREMLLGDAFAFMGLDSHVVDTLAKLDKLSPDSPSFEATWKRLNAYMVRQLTEAVRTIYRRAGVDTLIAKEESAS